MPGGETRPQGAGFIFMIASRQAPTGRPYGGRGVRTMSHTARELALEALTAYRRSGAWSETWLRARFEKEHTAPRDRALATALACGVLQNRLYLDERLGRFVRGGTEGLQPVLLDILRLSAYQLLFMDRIPPSAAVNEAVELAKKRVNPGAAKLTNAVLRRLAAEKDRLPEPAEPWVRHSHPKDWYDHFCAAIGPEKTLLLMQADNAPAPLTLRANPLKGTAEDLLARLRAEGAEAAPHPWLPGCVDLAPAGDPGALSVFRDGLALAQDAGAACAVLAAEPRPGEEVLDACAAPGGKSFLAAMLMGDEGRILARDLHEKKLARIRSGAKRLGLGCIEAAAGDASQPDPALTGRFDLVLADVPCSGLGVARRKPELRWKSFDSLKGLPEIQYAILKNLASFVKPGGRLLYSTCTLLTEENEAVTERFLRENPGWRREGFTLPGPLGPVPEGQRTLWPFEYGTDGFYLCRLRKETEN